VLTQQNSATFGVQGKTNVLGDYRPNSIAGSIWTDVSGNNNNLTLGTGACAAGATPTVNALSAGGGATFLGTSSQCIVLPAAFNSAFAFEIYYQKSDPGNNPTIPQESLLAGTASPANTLAIAIFQGGSNLPHHTNMTLQAAPVGGAATSTTIGTGTYGTQLITYVLDTTNDQFYTNGRRLTNIAGSVTLSEGHTQGNNTGGVYQLGGSSLLSYWFTGTILGFRVLSIEPTVTQQQADWNAYQFIMSQNGTPPAGIVVSGASNFIIGGGDSNNIGTAVRIPPSAVWGLNGQYIVENQGVSGTHTQGFAQDCRVIYQNLKHENGGKNVLLYNGAINDISPGIGNQTPLQAFNYTVNFGLCMQQQGWFFIPETLPSNQSAAVDALRDTYNTYLRTQGPNIFPAVADIAAIVNVGKDGQFSNATYFQGDTIHFTLLSINQYIGPAQAFAVNRFFGNNSFSNANTAKVGAAFAPFEIIPNNTMCVGGSGANPTCLFNVPNLAGTTLIDLVTWQNAVTTLTSAADTCGNTYTKVTAAAISGIAGTVHMQMLVSTNAVACGANTVTLTMSDGNATFIQQQMREIYGIISAGAVDVADAGNSGGTNAVTSNSITTTLPNEFLIHYIELLAGNTNASADFTPGVADTLFGLDGENQLGGNQEMQSMAWRITGAAGAQTSTSTIHVANSTNAGWADGIVAFKAGTSQPATYPMRASETYLNCDPTGGNITINLPDATYVTPGNVYIRNVSLTSTNSCTIAGINSETINGAASTVLPGGGIITLTAVLVSAQAAGANWTSTLSGSRVVSHTGGGYAFQQIVSDTGTLAGGTLAVTFTNAFSAATAYICSVTDTTTPANAVTITYTSASVVTFTGTGVDAIKYSCVGH
jgi:hypothetical protein